MKRFGAPRKRCRSMGDVFAGASIVTVLAFNLFGDGLRDALGPKQAR